ncbi:three-helix bundle dimerization domain-containing protein [Micromonospora sp. NPDC049175]|uniref:three-helix bundle dimerization domain-containing protein n=1 Tax=Micromonospora sp. NPDC049175 TaxID=3364266 RepID=UPI00371082C3
MTEPAASGGLVDPEIALRRQVETLKQRFPEADEADLSARVHETHARLKEEATVDSHLVALTEKQVTEDLRGGGKPVHTRNDETA